MRWICHEAACAFPGLAGATRSPGDMALASQEGSHSAAILHGDTYSHRKHSELWNNQPQDYQEPPHHQSQHCHPRHHQPQTYNCHSYHWPRKCHSSSHDQQHHHHHRDQPWILHQHPHPGPPPPLQVLAQAPEKRLGTTRGLTARSPASNSKPRFRSEFCTQPRAADRHGACLC